MITSVMIASPGFACSPTYEHAFESEMINLLAGLLNDSVQKLSCVLKNVEKSRQVDQCLVIHRRIQVGTVENLNE